MHENPRCHYNDKTCIIIRESTFPPLNNCSSCLPTAHMSSLLGSPSRGAEWRGRCNGRLGIECNTTCGSGRYITWVDFACWRTLRALGVHNSWLRVALFGYLFAKLLRVILVTWQCYPEPSTDLFIAIWFLGAVAPIICLGICKHGRGAWCLATQHC